MKELNTGYILRLFILSLDCKPNEKKTVKSGSKKIVCERVSDTDYYKVSSSLTVIELILTNGGVYIKRYNNIKSLNAVTQRAVTSYLYALFGKPIRRFLNAKQTRI